MSEIAPSIYAPGGHGANGFDYGLSLSGSYTFDQATPVRLTVAPPHVIHSYVIGDYLNSVRESAFMIGTYASGFHIGGDSSIFLSLHGVGYRVDNRVVGAPLMGSLPSVFSIELSAQGMTALNAIDLPGTQPPGIASFDTHHWRLVFSDGSAVAGTLNTLQPVPLPPTGLLFAGAVVGLALWRMRSSGAFTS